MQHKLQNEPNTNEPSAVIETHVQYVTGETCYTLDDWSLGSWRKPTYLYLKFNGNEKKKKLEKCGLVSVPRSLPDNMMHYPHIVQVHPSANSQAKPYTGQTMRVK
jgi:hypothetical protein